MLIHRGPAVEARYTHTASVRPIPEVRGSVQYPTKDRTCSVPGPLRCKSTKDPRRRCSRKPGFQKSGRSCSAEKGPRSAGGATVGRRPIGAGSSASIFLAIASTFLIYVKSSWKAAHAPVVLSGKPISCQRTQKVRCRTTTGSGLIYAIFTPASALAPPGSWARRGNPLNRLPPRRAHCTLTQELPLSGVPRQQCRAAARPESTSLRGAAPGHFRYRNDRQDQPGVEASE